MMTGKVYVTALRTFRYKGKRYLAGANLWVLDRDLERLIIDHKVQRIHHDNIQRK